MQEVKNKVQYYAIEELQLLEDNPRIITESQMSKLIKSIEDNPDYFEARPLILSNRTGKNVILAGNQRFRAAQALGMKQVPCVLLEGLDSDREKEIVIRDNVSNGAWDFDILANSWDEEKLGEWGVVVGKNFSDIELKDFFEEASPQEKEPKKVICPKCGEEFEV